MSSDMKGYWHYSNRRGKRQSLPNWTAAVILQFVHLRSTPHPVSPTVFRKQGFRFSFFSNEEPRMHIHVYCANGQAKFWLEPVIEVAENDGLRLSEIRKAQNIIEENEDEIRRRWQSHFGS